MSVLLAGNGAGQEDRRGGGASAWFRGQPLGEVGGAVLADGRISEGVVVEMTVDDVAAIRAHRNHVERVKLSGAVHMERHHMVPGETFPLAACNAGFAPEESLQPRRPLGRAWHARGGDTGIGLSKKAEHHFHTPPTFTLGCPSFHTPPTLT